MNTDCCADAIQIPIAVCDLDRVSSEGLAVEMDGKPTTLRRNGDYLTYDGDSNRYVIMAAPLIEDDEGVECVQFICMESGALYRWLAEKVKVGEDAGWNAGQRRIWEDLSRSEAANA
jgi:hypothetical protein